MSPAFFPVSLLQIAYLLDIIVSVPVVLIALMGNEASAQWLFGEKLPESQSTRTLLGALWLAILLCLILGVVFPVAISPILVLQLIYKSLWLILFAMPRWFHGKGEEVSGKLTVIFSVYIVVYPWIIPWNAIFTAG